jgi:ribonuclease-3
MLNIFRRRKSEDKEYYRLLKDIFGLRPNNVELYKLALIHRSASRFLKKGVPINNERLEFLGDAVIESVVSDYLFVAFPHENEGFLTQMRSKMVNRATLNELCKDIGLAQYIRNKANGGGVQRNMNGDAFEAIIGAMYLDKGYDFTSRTLVRVLEKNITLEEIRDTETDFKSRLIEWCQKGRHHLRFSTSYGPGGSQNAPQFKSVAIIDGLEVGYGLGSSKKEAEQRAAYTVSQALSDDMGEKILEMMDKSMGEAPAPKPKRRRKRGGVKHRKVASSTEVLETADSVETESKTDAPEVVETTVAEGVVSVSVERVEEAVEAPVKRRRGRPRKVQTRPEGEVKGPAEAKPEAETKPATTSPKAEAKSKADASAKSKTGAPAKRRGRPRKAQPESEAKKPATAKPKAQTKPATTKPKSAETKPKAQTKSRTDASVKRGPGRPRKVKPEEVKPE